MEVTDAAFMLICRCILQLLGHVLDQCSQEQLGMLRATCRTFAKCELIHDHAQTRCQAITRAQGLQPNFGCVVLTVAIVS